MESEKKQHAVPFHPDKPNIVFLVLLVLFLSTQVTLHVEGRTIPGSSQAVIQDVKVLRNQIGSKPPRCERRCHSCAHCEAIMVPTNPSISEQKYPAFDYDRGEGAMYKLMSWKCKCGSLIFNP